MPRGGKRQGTPGKGYSNRTDLLTVRAPATGAQTPASAGVPAPAAAPVPTLGQQEMPPGYLTPDQIPSLFDPTARPEEPVTAGLPVGPGGGVEALGPVPMPRHMAGLLAAYQNNPTPELRRAILLAQARGAL